MDQSIEYGMKMSKLIRQVNRIIKKNQRITNKHKGINLNDEED